MIYRRSGRRSKDAAQKLLEAASVSGSRLLAVSSTGPTSQKEMIAGQFFNGRPCWSGLIAADRLSSEALAENICTNPTVFAAPRRGWKGMVETREGLTAATA